jgi:hypothetical protein
MKKICQNLKSNQMSFEFGKEFGFTETGRVPQSLSHLLQHTSTLFSPADNSYPDRNISRSRNTDAACSLKFYLGLGKLHFLESMSFM